MRSARKLRRYAAAAAVCSTCLSARAALADDCRPITGISACIDAQALWLAPGRTRFFTMTSARAVPLERHAFGLGFGYALRPVVLSAPSPDPEGRDVNVVNHLFDASLSYAYGVADRIELSVALPFIVFQTGAGAAGATSQSAAAITSTTFRDPRLGAGFELFWRGSDAQGYGVKSRLELMMPLGNEQAYAGDASFGLAPSALLEVRHGRFWGASELGLRLRQPVELADMRWGSQLLVTLGLGFEIFRPDLLSVVAEAWVMPVLHPQEKDLRRSGRVEEAMLAPAEWLASLRSQPSPTLPLSFQLGAGTGIPLSFARRTTSDGSEQSESFAGVTTPNWRALLAVRYAPD